MAPRLPKKRVLTKKHVARLERERQLARLITILTVAIVLAVIGLIGYGILLERVIQPRQPVARVGNDVITATQFQARVRLQRQQLINQYIQYSQFSQFGFDVSSQLQQLQFALSEFGAQQIGQDVLDAMILERLMAQEAEKLGIVVADEEIQERLQALFEYYPNGTPTPTITPTEVILPTISPEQAAIVTLTPTPTATFTPTASPTSTPSPDATATPTPPPIETPTPAPTSTPFPTATPVTKEGFEASLAETLKRFAELGFSEADYRYLVYLEGLRTKLFEYVTLDMQPFEEQVWARHILVSDEETAKTMRERLLNGEDFAALAAEFSIDTATKDRGGDLGWFGRGQMVAPFEEAAFRQTPGEIGEPVQTEFGWHIIQVIGHDQNRPLTAEQFEQAKQRRFQEWLDDLRKRAEEAGQIEIFDYWKERVPLEPTLDPTLL